MVAASIVIPARNAAATLDATVESVIAQSRPDWEAIIVDDGSRDATPALAEAWSIRDERIRVVPGLQGGTAAARNRGARDAGASWLVFLDADDLLLPDYLAAMLKAASADASPDFVYCAGARSTPDGRVGPPEVPPTGDYFRVLARYDSFFTHSCMIRRRLFEDLGGFDPTLTMCEDWDLWLRFARAGATFAAVDQCLTRYRMRPGSLSRNSAELYDCGRQVILRAHGRDARVPNPVAELAEGLPAAQAAGALLGFAHWCAGTSIGAGQDLAPFLRRVELAPVSDFKSDWAVATLQYGVLSGACALLVDWPLLWPRVAGPIREALLFFERHCGVSDLARQCLERLEPRHPDAEDMQDEKAACARG